MRAYLVCTVIIAELLVSLSARALTMTPLAGFPTPAPGAYGLTAAALPDGRFLLWDGNTLLLQTSPGSTVFEPLASGYAGDPGFAAISPDGHTAILGAGFSGDLYLFDLAVPEDFAPEAVVANQAHFAGVFLNASLVLLDAGKPDFSGSELAVLDLSGAKAGLATVVRKSARYMKQKQVIVDKPPFSYSTSIAVDSRTGTVYAMDGNTRELRRFGIQDMVEAFQTHTMLDWESDGVLLGQPGTYYTGGVSGIAADGRLVIGGSEGYLLPGGIQLVNPLTGAITTLLDPSGHRSFYSVFFSPASQTILAMVEGAYLGEAYAVDLDASAAGDGGYSTGGLVEVGDSVCFLVPEESANGIQWYHNDELLQNQTFRELCLFNLKTADSGRYTAYYDDGAKSPAEYTVTITVVEQVPAAGWAGLAILIAGILCAAAGCLRRRAVL